MNTVCLIGNIAVEPELRQTASGKDVCTVRIGVGRAYRNENGVKESDFVNVQCWEQTARFVTKFLQKGDRIAVTGELRERQYEDKTGAKRYTMEVLATRVESLAGKREGTAEKGPAPAPGGGGFTAYPEDDELPF